MIEFAPAKINLCLHVTGQRPDGYHVLDSVVVFAAIGDQISCKPADHLSLDLTGPYGTNLLPNADNLVMRAARLMQNGQGAKIILEKNLPIASGIGGGSTDAAAALRALAKLWNTNLPDAESVMTLGADVPVCLAGRPARMQGVGEILSPLPQLPEAHLVLVNPGVQVSTPAIFAALSRRENPALSSIPDFENAGRFAAWLAEQRNDLESAAETLAPVIPIAKLALAAQRGCLLARMSGSGATCFGLFSTAQQARVAALAIASAQPNWWVKPAKMLS